jgi:hypothetical protein
MLLHATHNGLLVLIGHYQEKLTKLGIGVQEKEHLPRLWLAAAAGGVAVGVVLVWLATLKGSKR